MTPEKSRILMTIKQHIDDSIYNDFSKFWTNKLDKIQPMKANDPKNFFKNIRHLRGTGPHNNGTLLLIMIQLQTLTNKQKFLPTLGKTHSQTTPPIITIDMQLTIIMKSDTGYSITWASLTHIKIQILIDSPETLQLQNPHTI